LVDLILETKAQVDVEALGAIAVDFGIVLVQHVLGIHEKPKSFLDDLVLGVHTQQLICRQAHLFGSISSRVKKQVAPFAEGFQVGTDQQGRRYLVADVDSERMLGPTNEVEVSRVPFARFRGNFARNVRVISPDADLFVYLNRRLDFQSVVMLRIEVNIAGV